MPFRAETTECTYSYMTRLVCAGYVQKTVSNAACTHVQHAWPLLQTRTAAACQHHGAAVIEVDIFLAMPDDTQIAPVATSAQLTPAPWLYTEHTGEQLRDIDIVTHALCRPGKSACRLAAEHHVDALLPQPVSCRDLYSRHSGTTFTIFPFPCSTSRLSPGSSASEVQHAVQLGDPGLGTGVEARVRRLVVQQPPAPHTGRHACTETRQGGRVQAAGFILNRQSRQGGRVQCHRMVSYCAPRMNRIARG